MDITAVTWLCNDEEQQQPWYLLCLIWFVMEWIQIFETLKWYTGMSILKDQETCIDKYLNQTVDT